MGHLPKLAALTMLSATAVLGVACVAGDDLGEDQARTTPAETLVSEPVNQSSEALQVSDAQSTQAQLATDDGPTGEAAEAQGWSDRWYQCRPWRQCLNRYGYYSCYRWMPRLGDYCSGSPGYPGGGYPGYPGGGYPGYPSEHGHDHPGGPDRDHDHGDPGGPDHDHGYPGDHDHDHGHDGR